MHELKAIPFDGDPEGGGLETKNKNTGEGSV